MATWLAINMALKTITAADSKEKLREEIKLKRDSMTDEEAERKSSAAAKSLMKIAEYANARVVMLYAAKGNEVRSRQLIESALKEGKTVLLPITNTEKKEIEPAMIENYDSDLMKGAFGIMQPKQKSVFDVSIIDTIVVPGVAFDIDGHRLGYGHGFYDKLLKRLTAVKIGLAYDLQLLEKLPRESHDERMDIIVTESRVIRFSGRA